jgi:hypothetical protein
MKKLACAYTVISSFVFFVSTETPGRWYGTWSLIQRKTSENKKLANGFSKHYKVSCFAQKHILKQQILLKMRKRLFSLKAHVKKGSFCTKIKARSSSRLWGCYQNKFSFPSRKTFRVALLFEKCKAAVDKHQIKSLIKSVQQLLLEISVATRRSVSPGSTANRQEHLCLYLPLGVPPVRARIFRCSRLVLNEILREWVIFNYRLETQNKSSTCVAQNIVFFYNLYLERLNTKNLQVSILTGLSKNFPNAAILQGSRVALWLNGNQNISANNAVCRFSDNLADVFKKTECEVTFAIDYFYLDAQFSDHDYDPRPWLWLLTRQITEFFSPHGFFLAENLYQTPGSYYISLKFARSLQFLVNQKQKIKKLLGIRYTDATNVALENDAIDSVEIVEDEAEDEEKQWEEQNYMRRPSTYSSDFLNMTVIMYNNRQEEIYLPVRRVVESIHLYKICYGMTPSSQWVDIKRPHCEITILNPRVKKTWSTARRQAHRARKVSE